VSTKSKYRSAASLDSEGEALDEKIGGVVRPAGQWAILYYGITLPIRFVLPATPPPPTP